MKMNLFCKLPTKLENDRLGAFRKFLPNSPPKNSLNVPRILLNTNSIPFFDEESNKIIHHFVNFDSQLSQLSTSQFPLIPDPKANSLYFQRYHTARTKLELITKDIRSLTARVSFPETSLPCRHFTAVTFSLSSLLNSRLSELSKYAKTPTITLKLMVWNDLQSSLVPYFESFSDSYLLHIKASHEREHSDPSNMLNSLSNLGVHVVEQLADSELMIQNQDLAKELSHETEQLEKIEQVVTTIGQLQTKFSHYLLEQHEQTMKIIEQNEDAKESVKKGNVELVTMTTRSKKSRFTAPFLIFLAGVILYYCHLFVWPIDLQNAN